jgi:hypothetical protein
LKLTTSRHGLTTRSKALHEPRLIICCYFVLTTLSTVGYGDLTPQTNSEKILGISFMIFGVAFFSYIMGNFNDVLSNYDKKMGIVDRR